MQQTSEEKLEHWKEIIERADASGLSIPDWCRQNDVTAHQLAYWRGKIMSCYGTDAAGFHSVHKKDQDAGKAYKERFIEFSFDDDEPDYPEKPASPTRDTHDREVGATPENTRPEIRIETSSLKIFVTNGIEEQTLRMVLKVVADA